MILLDGKQVETLELNASDGSKVTKTLVEVSESDEFINGLIDTTSSSGSYENTEVTSIRPGAFRQTNFNSISIPNATTLGQDAFRDCKNLEYINIPNVTNGNTNGQSANPSQKCATAFQNCSALKSFVYPQRMTFTSTMMFQSCTSLEFVDLGIATFSNQLFKGCKKLNTLILRYTGGVTYNTSAFQELTRGQEIDVYVPSALVESYQNSSYWNGASSQGTSGLVFHIKAIEGSEYE